MNYTKRLTHFIKPWRFDFGSAPFTGSEDLGSFTFRGWGFCTGDVFFISVGNGRGAMSWLISLSPGCRAMMLATISLRTSWWLGKVILTKDMITRRWCLYASPSSSKAFSEILASAERTIHLHYHLPGLLLHLETEIARGSDLKARNLTIRNWSERTSVGIVIFPRAGLGWVLHFADVFVVARSSLLFL